MGVALTVRVPPGRAIAWADLASRLAARGVPAAVRMIDGLPAFPDEEPPADWRELRLGTPAGMVTLRRSPEDVTCTVWGNADTALERAQRAIAWAVADAAGGNIDTGGREISAGEFERTIDSA
jgi:hypothetical protein